MLDFVLKTTNEFMITMPKSVRKEYGQFFTSKETAVYMASLFQIPEKETLYLLDAGAGSGILIAALIQRLEDINFIKKINITCYETDLKILPLLTENLKYIKTNSKKKIVFEIITENYITSQSADFYAEQSDKKEKYDLIIGNPPYKKVPKDCEEAKSLPSVCYGAPNLYFLFATLALFNLKEESELVYIIPRSWTSGAYFKAFREYFLSNGVLTHIHLFQSRDKVFDGEQVLQETIIIKVKKTKKHPKFVTITSTPNSSDFSKQNKIKINYDSVVSGKNKYVFLITDENDKSTLERINKYKNTLPDLDMKMKTGLTVDFRNRDILKNNFELGVIPLFYSQHIKDGMVSFPINKENEYIIANMKGLLQDNKNYLFVKRFTAKEEKQRLQCGIYLSKNVPGFEKISTQNKINFIDGITEDLTEETVYGLYVLFNSSLYDNYYRILNGSTQVNSTEVNTIPIPPKDIINTLGKELKKQKDLSQKTCDEILEKFNV